MYDLLLGLLGFFIGLGLAVCTKAELEKLRKPLRFIQHLLFAVMELVLLLFLFQTGQLAILAAILVLFLIVLFLQLKLKSRPGLTTIFSYAIIILSYSLVNSADFRYLITSLAFLYGLPAGTLYYLVSIKTVS